MKIIIDYNGSIAECRISGVTGDGEKYNLPIQEAPPILQSIALTAFRTIRKDLKRDKNG